MVLGEETAEPSGAGGEEIEAPQRGRRRGRRPTRTDPASGPVAAFADLLWRLKQEAGDPSYEEMSARLGAAASKSSLASAAQGRNLPSWETTWEFVRVLAVTRLGNEPLATEREWRERWEQAKAASTSPSTSTSAQATEISRREPEARPEPEPEPEPAERAEPAEPVRARPEPPRASPRWHHRRLLVGSVAVICVAATGIGLAFVVGRQTAQSEAAQVPRPVDPLQSDDSRFEGDITYPDGTPVPPGSSFKKVWRIRNTGTVYWNNRFLARVNQTPCEAPDAVPVPPTRPGETVDLAVWVRAPKQAARCKIYWKMADEQGRTLFPLKRPIFLDVQVTAPSP